MPDGVIEFQVSGPEPKHSSNGKQPCQDYDPCRCAPGQNKEIVFNRETCLSTDQRFLWDYEQGLLTIDGRIATSGYISTSAQCEAAYFAPKALGLGAFDFTPPSGYGGLAYGGGGVFYYWNNSFNEWEPIDFGGEDVIDVYHNGTIVATTHNLNFVDSTGITWALSSNGEVNIVAFATGGGAWIGDVNANGFCILNLGCIVGAPGFNITNLSTINGIPVSSFITNPWTQNVNANGFSLSNLYNLSVSGEIYYQGQTIEDWLLTHELWHLNADGSIQRDSGLANSYAYLNTTGTPAFVAWAASFGGVYGGELGFSPTDVELWTTTRLIIQGFESDGHVYIPGRTGINNQVPAYNLDVGGNVNASNCYFVAGLQFACYNGAGGINLSNITNINGGPVGGIGQTPWQSNINAAGYGLSNLGSLQMAGPANIYDTTDPCALTITGNVCITGNINVSGTGTFGSVSAGSGTFTNVNIGSAIINTLATSTITSTGNINTNGCYTISGMTFACSNGSGIDLSNIDNINGSTYPPPAGGVAIFPPALDMKGQRAVDSWYQNQTSGDMFVSVIIGFPGLGAEGTTGLWVNIAPNNNEGFLDFVSSFTFMEDIGNIVTLQGIVPPGYWYYVSQSYAGFTIGAWWEYGGPGVPFSR